MTNTIAISYTIYHDDTYSDRFAKLRDRLPELGEILTDDTTSFYLIETYKSVGKINTALYGSLDYVKDSAYVMEIFRSSIKNFGKAKNVR